MTVKVTLMPHHRIISLPSGSKLSKALLDINMLLPCGGHGLCGKCRVTIKGSVHAPTESECQLLTAAEITAGVRLACQYEVTEDITVWLPLIINHEIEFTGRRKQSEGTYYLAVDLGTTSLKEVLYDAQTGEALARVKVNNKQGCYGADILSRLSYALQSAEKWHQLHALLIESINQGLEMIISKTDIQLQQIISTAFAGNTVMTALFLGRYTDLPWDLDEFVLNLLKEEWQSKTLGLSLSTQCQIKIFPPIAKHVGGDMLSGIWGTDLCVGHEIKMLIDIGTNVEIALHKDGSCFVCSTAAGPAFEAANISQGMPALPGAICQGYRLNNKFYVETIANRSAVGICGSGLFSVLNASLKSGLVLKTGKIKDANVITLSEQVCLTQNDIRQFQLAKAAVRTGIDIILQYADISADQVESLLIAGDFGNHVAIADLAEVGVIPQSFIKKAKLVGNSCLGGLKKALFEGYNAKSLNNRMKFTHVDLAQYCDFESIFISNISF